MRDDKAFYCRSLIIDLNHNIVNISDVRGSVDIIPEDGDDARDLALALRCAAS